MPAGPRPALAIVPEGDRSRRRDGGAVAGPSGSLVVEVDPPGPYRLSTNRWPDGVARTRAGVWERFLHVGGRPVLLRAWEVPSRRRVAVAAVPVPTAWTACRCEEPAGRPQLETAIERGRHALAVDDDIAGFQREFARDPLLGQLIHRFPALRIRRCPNPWEAFAWAITEQLIESTRAAVIQRRIVARWGPRLQVPGRRRELRDIPSAARVAALAPAELASLDLAPKRAVAMIRAAREIAAGRCDPSSRSDDRRLLSISDIGPWTIQCLGQNGRGDFDSLPAGDLAYLKLVGGLAGLGRRATIAEVHEFFAPYAPYRGLAGRLALAGHGRALQSGPPLPYHPPDPAMAN